MSVVSEIERQLNYTRRVIANIARQAQEGPVVLSIHVLLEDNFLHYAILEIMFGADRTHGLTVTESGENYIITAKRKQISFTNYLKMSR